MILRSIVGALIWATLISGIVWAGAGVQPGKYLAKGASGTLVIEVAKAGALSFAIESTGSNGHTCSINGEIPAGANRALVPTSEGEKPCIVVFRKVTAGISVETPDTDSCQDFCGARASFDLAYDKVDGKCWPKAVRGQRAEFKRAYEKKDFATARDRLDGALKDCKDYIDEFDRYRMLNDLAITLHHLGDDAGCLKVLEPMAGLAATPDKEYDDDPTLEAEQSKKIGRATRTNQELCKAK
jgi:hypothetical protein